MKRLILAVIMMGITTIGCCEESSDYKQYLQQEPKQIDCQAISIDQREYNWKHVYEKICFYEVTFGNPQRKAIMWVNIKNGRYGFLNE